jgi:hypothetical protein
MDDRDQRATALSQLKSDLAELALRLEALEARRKGQSLTATIKASPPMAPDMEFAKQIVFAMKSHTPNTPLSPTADN